MKKDERATVEILESNNEEEKKMEKGAGPFIEIKTFKVRMFKSSYIKERLTLFS